MKLGTIITEFSLTRLPFFKFNIVDIDPHFD